MHMKIAPYMLVAGLLLAVATVTTQAQEKTRATPQVRQGIPAAPEATYSGTSIQGNFQEALNSALSSAQAGVAKTTNIADAQFNFKVAEITGKRGGLMGTQELTVKVQILGSTASPH
jgi:hypothetical protein